MGRQKGSSGRTTETPEAASARAFLRQAMAENGWTVGRTAAILKMPAGQIAGLLKAYRAFPPHALERLANETGFPVKGILEWGYDEKVEEELKKAKAERYAKWHSKDGKPAIRRRATKKTAKKATAPATRKRRAPPPAEEVALWSGGLTAEESAQFMRHLNVLMEHLQTQSRVEEHLGIGSGVVAMLLSGKKAPTLFYARKLAAGFGVHLVELLWPEFGEKRKRRLAAESATTAGAPS